MWWRARQRWRPVGLHLCFVLWLSGNPDSYFVLSCSPRLYLRLLVQMIDPLWQPHTSTLHRHSPPPAQTLTAPAALTPGVDAFVAFSDWVTLLPTLLHGHLLALDWLFLRKGRERKGRGWRQKNFKGATWKGKELVRRDLVQIKIHCLSFRASPSSCFHLWWHSPNQQ